MVGRYQYGYITLAFSGSPWWGEINLERSARGGHEQKMCETRAKVGKNPNEPYPKGGILALRATLDYVPREEPTGTPLGNTLRIRRPKLDWKDLPSSCVSQAQHKLRHVLHH